jgi:PEP-CTERM motif
LRGTFGNFEDEGFVSIWHVLIWDSIHDCQTVLKMTPGMQEKLNMKKRGVHVFKKTILLAIVIGWSPVSLLAQTAPTFRVIPVVFTGVVENDVGSSIRIRQPDGSFVPYTGPVPAYPYSKGDVVTISFDATVPTRDFYTSSDYRGQIAADGIYRIGISGPNGFGGTTSIGLGSNYDVSGPIRQGVVFGQPIGSTGLTIVYNSVNDDYSIDFPNNRWTAAKFDGPSFTYNSTTGMIGSSNTTCIGSAGCTDLGDAGISLSGNATQIQSGNIIISDLARSTSGIFNLIFSGNWNLPIFGSGGNGGGDPTDVPEPGSVLLFAGGVSVLMRRQRKGRLA